MSTYKGWPMRKIILLGLGFVLFVSCKTVPIDPTPVDTVEAGAEVIQGGAQEIITKTVEVEKIVERLVTITDGEARKDRKSVV